MIGRHVGLALALAFFIAGVLGPPAAAQSPATASLIGSVHDASDAIVPDAVVQARRCDTGQTWETRTDPRGRFALLNLPVGQYRLDIQASGFALANVGSANARNVGGLNDISRGTRLDDRDQTIAASHFSALSSRTLNEARAQYTRSRLNAPVNDITGPAVNIAGVASWGTATFSPNARDLDVIEAVDTLTTQRGSHLLKAGADLLYNRVNIVFPGALQGVYTFSSLASYQPARMSISSRRSARPANASRIRTSGFLCRTNGGRPEN